ncbi:MAG: GTP cyclohydrolase FolE2 [Thermodesulfobacteriota bacterium]
MIDVQNEPSEVPLSIDRVGVKNLKFPLTVQDRFNGRQKTVASTDLSVDLPGSMKGTHMSRLMQALSSWECILNYKNLYGLLKNVCARLHARRAHVKFSFPYFMPRRAPKSGNEFLMDYDCFVAGNLEDEDMQLNIGVSVPVMTVCPCSLAISDEGAHSQRAMVRVQAGFTGFLWLEELIEIAQNSGSSPVYPLLKREDEKFVTESAFSNPTFVEDVVRGVAQRLEEHSLVTWFSAEVESFESIHNHSAYANIKKSKNRHYPS